MIMDERSGLSPSDLLVALKLGASPNAGISATLRRLGQELGLSKSAVGNSLKRLDELGLLSADGRKQVNKVALLDLLENAVRWVAPARVGDYELGLPTAHSAGVLAKHLLADDDPVVMPLPHGPMRGRAVPPIHPLAAKAAARDERLHELLAIVDALRIGRARDRQVAVRALRAWL